MISYSFEIFFEDFDVPLVDMSRHSGFRLVETKDDGSIKITNVEVTKGNLTEGMKFKFETFSGDIYQTSYDSNFVWGSGTNTAEIEYFNARYVHLESSDVAIECFKKALFYAKLMDGLRLNGEGIDYDTEGPCCNTFTSFLLGKFNFNTNIYSSIPKKDGRDYYLESFSNNGFHGTNPNGFIEDNGPLSVLRFQAIDNLYNELTAKKLNNIIFEIGDANNFSVNYDEASLSVSVSATRDNGSKLLIGNNGAETLIGTTSDDKIIGFAGNDVLNGGAGNDTYVFNSGDGEDTIFDDSGDNDSIVVNEDIADYNAYRSGNDLVIENTTGDKITVTNNFDGSAIEKISFNNNSDIIYGTSSAKTLNGGIGDDILLGGTENNIYQFVAGDGQDRIYDESGTDTIKITGNIEDYVETCSDNDLVINKIDSQDQITVKNHFGGNLVEKITFNNDADIMYANSTGERLRGGNGNDKIYGGSGRDTLYGESGADELYGGAGNDKLYIDAADTIIDGGDGDDTAYLQEARTFDLTSSNIEKVYGSTGDDIIDGSNSTVGLTLAGNDGNDTLKGGVGDDTLVGGSGADELYGGAGNDTIQIDAADTIIDGGDGIDTVYLQEAITFDLAASNIEKALGSTGYDIIDGSNSAADLTITGREGNDTLKGGTGNDSLNGDTGADKIYGGAGDDTLVGGSGADELYGGAGDDILYIDAADTIIDGGDGYDAVILQEAMFINLTASNIEEARGSTGNDIIDGSNSTVALIINSYKGNDILYGGSGDDHLYGDDGDDILDGGSGNDRLYAGKGHDILYGGDDDDRLYGDSDDVILYGGSGNDVLYGDEGNDTLDGGSGNDNLRGGSNNDTYIFGIGYGVDTIREESGYDTLYITGGLSASNVTFFQENTTMKIYLNSTFEHVDIYGQYDLTDSGYRIEKINFDDFSINIGDLTNLPQYGTDEAETLTGNDLGCTLVGMGGDDNITGGTGDDNVFGGTGDDTLITLAGNDILDGGEGNDILMGGHGSFDTYLFGTGSDHDTIIETGDVADVIMLKTGLSVTDVTFTRDGNDLVLSINDGNDTMRVQNHYSDANAVVEFLKDKNGGDIDLTDPTLTAAPNEIIGTEERDVIYGTSDSDIIYGFGGNDYLRGDAGDDILEGGADNDVLIGGAGADTLRGGDGNDSLYIDSDDVEINGGEGSDVATMQTAMTLDLAATSIENVNGSTGDDVINGSNSTVRVVAYGNNGNDTILGGSANDYLRGDAGDDILEGGADNDVLIGGAGADTLRGGDGNDSLYIDSDDVEINGGDGSDVATLQTAMTLDLAATSIENVNGSAGDDVINGSNSTVRVVAYGNNGNDTILGGSANDYLRGDAGDDILEGGADNDVLIGGAGADTLRGGDGNDSLYIDSDDVEISGGEGSDVATLQTAMTLDLAATSIENVNGSAGDDVINGSNSTVRIVAYGNNGNDTILGGSANDYLRGDAGDDILEGGADNDVLIGGAGADTLRGGDGNDSLYIDSDDIEINGGEGSDVATLQTAMTLDLAATSIENVIGSAGDDVINGSNSTVRVVAYGNNGNDTILGGSANDYLRGDAGDDILEGGADNDVLIGGAGADTLRGGDGNDTLYGGAGNDTYEFARGDGVDSIVNQDADGTDIMNISNADYDELWFSQQGQNLKVSIMGSSDAIVFNNWYGSDDAQIDQFTISDGFELDRSSVDLLVQAMSSFNPQGMSSISEDETLNNALASTLEQTWHARAV
ncbi:MAG: beta strand repeat-containing protein [Alphaproteobacteria bacterium]